MRIVFALLLFVHGLLHLMGFAKAFKPDVLPELSGHFSKTAGIFWLAAAVFIVLSACLFLMGREGWWMLAVPALLLSQVLIFLYWKDARFGSIANIILLAGILPAYGNWRFNRMISRELQTFLPIAMPADRKITRSMIAPLPAVVRRWLEHSNMIGKNMVHTAYLTQKGSMKTKPGGNWMPFEAEQWNTVDQPGFIWTTTMHLPGGIPLYGRDKYEDGRGHMRIELLALYPIVDSKGPQMDQGTLLRNLAEICWMPSAALGDYIHWEELDSLSARATMTCGGISASGVFYFNTNGDILRFEARRYYDRKEGATLENWVVENTAFADFGGVRIPCKSEISWDLADGRFTWLQLEVVELEYNPPAIKD